MSAVSNMVPCLLLMLLFNLRNGYAHGVTTRKALYVFGDSLFDPGNNQYYTPDEFIPANHYPYGMSFVGATGRHSDGLLVPDLIAQYASMQLIPPYMDNAIVNSTLGYNFASAGSGCLNITDKSMNLDEQLAAFDNATQELDACLGPEQAKILLQNAVYMFSAGGNDYLTYVTEHKNTSDSDKKEYVQKVIEQLTRAVEFIYGKGGRKFAFQDVGPLGCLPTIKFFNGQLVDACVEEALYLAQTHNSALRETLKAKKESQDYSDIKYGVFDYYNQLLNRLDNPSYYGFTVSNIACCGMGGYINGKDCGDSSTGYFLCSNPSSFVMFDGAHTTQNANSQLAKHMWSGNQSFIAPYNVKQLFQDDQGTIEMI